MATTGDLAAEKLICLSVVGEPKLLDYVSDLLEPAAFGEPLTRAIYKAVLELRAERERITPTAVRLRLGDQAVPGWFDDGRTAQRTTGEEVRQAARHLSELLRRSTLVETGRKILGEADSRSSLDTATALRALVDGQLERTETDTSTDGLAALDARVKAVEEAAANPSTSARVRFTTGLDAFDRSTGGLEVGRLTVVAARPSQGKSALAVAIAAHLARTGVRTAVFWLEDEADKFSERLASVVAGVPFAWARSPDPKPYLEAIRRSRREWMRNVTLDSSKGLTAEQIAARMRRLARVNGVRVFIADHLGEMRVSRGDWGDRHDLALGDAVRVFRNAAVELNAAPVLFAQMNRQVEGRANELPRMSDVQGSGQIEQCARTLAFIRRGEGESFELVMRKPTSEVLQFRWDEDRCTVENRQPQRYPPVTV